MAPKLTPKVLGMWNEISRISIDFNRTVPVDPVAKAKYRVINVLWSNQLADLVAISVDHRIQANHIIDAVRGATPRPTLSTYPKPGDTPVYPEDSQFGKVDTAVGDRYTSTVSVGSASASDLVKLINPILPKPLPIKPPIKPPFPPPPPAPLPSWWYDGVVLYKMVISGDYYLSTPVEPINGPNFGVWAASMFYGMMGLVYYYHTFSDAEDIADSYIVRYRSVLDRRGRIR